MRFKHRIRSKRRKRNLLTELEILRQAQGKLYSVELIDAETMQQVLAARQSTHNAINKVHDLLLNMRREDEAERMAATA